MSATVLQRAAVAELPTTSTTAPSPSLVKYPPRPAAACWPATELSRERALTTLSSAPFVLDQRKAQSRRVTGLRVLLDWLTTQPGTSWQERWLASGADAAGPAWREVPAGWLHQQGYDTKWRQEALVEALPVAVSAEPDPPQLAVAGHRRAGARWPAGPQPGNLSRPGRVRPAVEHCNADPRISAVVAGQIRYLTTQILAAKGGAISHIVLGDVLELFDTEDAARLNTQGSRRVFYRVLRELGVLDAQAPPTLRALRTSQPPTPEQLIDRYRVRCRPIRDLLVDYLRERQPALDHTSLKSLANFLGGLFWADIERHHPDVTTLHLPPEVAQAWKRRLRTITKTTKTTSGEVVERTVERINYRECLTPVRAFYLDLAHWAVEDPARWGPWVAPCPVGEEEINRKKAQRRLKARMDARTRERLPALPALVRALDHHRQAAHELLEAARGTPSGQPIAFPGLTVTRSRVDPRTKADRIWVDDPSTGKRRDLTREEDHAFWAWAIVEILRATGIRVEELTELSHHSLPDAVLCGPARNTAPPPTRSGKSSSATGSDARSPSAPAPARWAPHASTNTPASDARSYGQSPPSDHAWKRSATTCAPASPKRTAKAGSVSRRTASFPRRGPGQTRPTGPAANPGQPRHASHSRQHELTAELTPTTR
jgi:hypothetical protein